MKFFIQLSGIIILLVIQACKKDNAIKEATIDPVIEKPADTKKYGSVSISFNNMAGDEHLILNNAHYLNANGDSFTVSKFKYYISNIILKKSDGSSYVAQECYHLIDSNKGNKYTLVLDSVPTGYYNAMTFVLGVDSARNTSGAQTGALDPSYGMFWSWNQGYIFLMMEGNSPNSTAFNNTLIFHLGGFTQPYNCIRTITPGFGAMDLISNEGKTSKIEINTDVLKLFENPTLIKFAQTSEGMGGAVAVTIANNCKNMFNITAIEN